MILTKYIMFFFIIYAIAISESKRKTSGKQDINLPLGLPERANVIQMEVPLIYHNSKISLNSTSKTIELGIPQRVFDILNCDGKI